MPRARCVRDNDIVFLQEGGTAGRCGHRPLRNRIMGCVGEGLCPSHGRGRTPPLRRGTKSAGKESPSHGFAVPAPFRQGGLEDGGTDCHDQFANWSRNDRLLQGVRYSIGGRTEASAPTDDKEICTSPGTGRCGEQTERCRWQRKRSERVAAVKISSVRRKAAQKFWAPQQGHRPLRRVTRGTVGRATARVAPTEGAG